LLPVDDPVKNFSELSESGINIFLKQILKRGGGGVKNDDSFCNAKLG